MTTTIIVKDKAHDDIELKCEFGLMVLFGENIEQPQLVRILPDGTSGGWNCERIYKFGMGKIFGDACPLEDDERNNVKSEIEENHGNASSLVFLMNPKVV